MSTQMEAAANHIIAKLIAHGEQAYKVGGYVRDLLMHRPIHDIDITTSALPERVITI